MHIFTYCVLGAAERPNATYVKELSSLSLFGILDKVYTFVHLLHQTLFTLSLSLSQYMVIYSALSLSHVSYLPAYASRVYICVKIDLQGREEDVSVSMDAMRGCPGEACARSSRDNITNLKTPRCTVQPGRIAVGRPQVFVIVYINLFDLIYQRISISIYI